MTTILVVAACCAFLVAAAFLAAPPGRTHRYELPTGPNISHPAGLPGPIAVLVGNLSRWSGTRRFGGAHTVIDRNLTTSGNPWGVTVGQFRAIVAMAAVAGAFAGALLGFPLGTIFGYPWIGVAIAAISGAVLGSFTPAQILQGHYKKRIRGVTTDLDVALDMLVMAMQSGLTLQQALRDTHRYLPDAELRDELEQVATAIDSGVPFDDALNGLAQRIPDTQVLQFVKYLTDTNTDGRDRTAYLRRAARTIRQTRGVNLKAEAERSTITATAVCVLTLVPGFLAPIAVYMWPLISETGLLG